MTRRNRGRSIEPFALFEQRAIATESTVMFTIYERSTLRPIGYTMLDGMTFRLRSAEFEIHIGESDGHGKGYGTETARLMLDYAFATLGLHSVCLTVAEYNLAGCRAYERAGFRDRVADAKRGGWGAATGT